MVKNILLSAFMGLLFSFGNQALDASERKTLFNQSWKFHRGSVANAEQPSYDDAHWRPQDLPHDWSIEPAPIQMEGITIGPFSKLNEGGAGGADIGQTLGGEGWYRKNFTLEKEDQGKQILLYFEGVYNQSEVWVNGHKASFNPYGYTSYRVDITPYCHAAGIANVIAVKVVNVGQNSRWYSGSGIFRHVWLIKTAQLHLDEWDTFVDASELKGKDAVVKFSTTVHNQQSKRGSAELLIKILSPDGNLLYSSINAVELTDETIFTKSFILKNPVLWSVKNPALHRAEISLSANGNELDNIMVYFGVRTIQFSPQKGFQLNGKTMKLKGGCIHHDNGLLGAVAINRAEERKVELLKANGFNAVRCAHNQVSESFLEACDRHGLLVIHETFDQWQKPKRGEDYHQYFDAWSATDLEASVRRDRNHPSIIMWSIGNEIEQRADSAGVEIAKKLVSVVKEYDSSRFITVGANDFWDRRQFEWSIDSERAFRYVDVAGYNYVWSRYEADHQAYPQRIIYGSESYPKEAAQNWNLVEKHPYIVGDFVWTALDYLGEAGLGHTDELGLDEHNSQFKGWPWYNSWCGDVDLCGDKKPQSFYRDVVWRESDISMAVRPPVAIGKREFVNNWGWTDERLSWSWKGLEGQPMRVNVYSRSPRVRLYLNGLLIGDKEPDKENFTAVFEVPYAQGELKAVNVVKNKERASMVLTKVGEPAAIRLVADRNQINADKNDLAYIKIEIVDADNQVIPDAAFPIVIHCSGVGSVAASGNASPNDMRSFRSLTPVTFRGKAIAVVQPDGSKGRIELKVSGEGIGSSLLTIDVE